MFRFLTSGESHGKGLNIIIDGVPAGLELDEDYIQGDLARRQVGYGRGGRMQIEKDRAEIFAGVRHGLTLGSPISLYVQNRDWVNWQDRMSASPVDVEIETVTRVRPGHADLTGAVKYGHRDVRNILERASARETAARVAAGAVARKLLAEFGVSIHSHTLAIGEVRIAANTPQDWEKVEQSVLRCADELAEKRMIELIDQAKADGDTLGGIIEVIAEGLPIGLGSHVQWDRKLDGKVAQAFMSINAFKGVEIGAGFEGVRLRGSQFHDVIDTADKVGSDHLGNPWRHLTNRAGGIVGGISNGEPIVVRAAVKPIPTLAKPLPSVDLLTGEPVQAHFERSDVCVVPAAGVVGEAMLAIVLADAMLEKFGGDHISEMKRNYVGYMKAMALESYV